MLKTYKYWILLVLGVIYSVAVWHVSDKYHAAQWEKEKTALVAKALDTTVKRAELAAVIGKTLEESLAKQKATQTIIHQKVIRETIRDPIYTKCVTTDAGVRLIDEAIDNQ